MNVKFLAAAAFSAAMSVSSSAFAATLVLPFDGGWYYDQVNSARVHKASIELIIPAGDTGTFSLTDGFIPGDVYKITIGRYLFEVDIRLFSDYIR